jgi:hypothetical protein
MEPIIKNWIERSLTELFKQDGSYLIDRELREECINHRLAFYLEVFRPVGYAEYYIDLEYDKNASSKKSIIQNGVPTNIRPDIIIHKRTDDIYDNLLAFECKKWNLSKDDKSKLTELKRQNYNYQYCIGIGYRPNEETFLLYEESKRFTNPKRIAKNNCLF